MCLDSGSDNNINLNVVDSNFNIFDYTPSVSISVPNVFDNLIGISNHTIDILYDSLYDCSVQKSFDIDYSILYDTEFKVFKLRSDSSEVFQPDSIDILLCNDEKILLKKYKCS